MARRTLLLFGTVIALLTVAGTSALGQEVPPEAAWQQAADSARFPLLAPPSPAGFALQSLTTESPACDGQANTLARAQYGRPDGAVIVLRQYDGACDAEYSQEVGSIPLRGSTGTVVTTSVGPCVLAADAASCSTNAMPDGRGIVYDAGGIEAVISSNLAGFEPLFPLLETAPVAFPSAGLGPLYERFQALVLKVTSPDRLTVRANGQVRGIRLAGIVAPRAKQCWAPQALRYAKRLFPSGRTLWFEDDPSAGTSFWVFRNFGDGPVPTREPVNASLVEIGAARTSSGRWRHSLSEEQSFARKAKYGVWGKACGGKFKPPKTTGPTSPTPRPVGFVSPTPQPSPSTPVPGPSTPAPSTPAPTPTPSTPGDIYNCGNFPLSDGTTAQQYLARYPSDPSRLDGDHDGVACES